MVSKNVSPLQNMTLQTNVLCKLTLPQILGSAEPNEDLSTIFILKTNTRWTTTGHKTKDLKLPILQERCQTKKQL